MQGRRTPACQRPCRAQRRVSASSATVEAPAATNQVLIIHASLFLLGSLQTRRQAWGTQHGVVMTVQTQNREEEPLLLRALNGEKVERPPVWMMRQAGRYMKVRGC